MIKLKIKRKPNENVDRKFFIDKYNDKKIWEVAFLKGSNLVRQYLKKNDGTHHLLGKGSRRNEKELLDLGILDFKEISKVEFIWGDLMDKCFAEDKEIGCTALKVKDCEGCAFYKTEEQARESNEKASERLKSLKYKAIVYFKNRNGIPNIPLSYIEEKYGLA